MNKNRATIRTIENFSDQWTRFPDNEGYYGSLELFSDILFPFLKIEDLKDCKVAEIGSGTGRIVNMLLEAGARQVIALEPSKAFPILKKNIKIPEKVTCLNITGEQLPAYADLDYVFSIGVLHHIPDPRPVVEAAWRALRPGGRFLVWLYGKEGNELYLALIRPLRILTTKLPDLLLSLLVWILFYPLKLYLYLSRIFPLPLRGYLQKVFGKMSPGKQRLIIYDQLNPSYAKYYTKREAVQLVEEGGFVDVQAHHRHGYSWTVIGTKPQ